MKPHHIHPVKPDITMATANDTSGRLNPIRRGAPATLPTPEESLADVQTILVSQDGRFDKHALNSLNVRTRTEIALAAYHSLPGDIKTAIGIDNLEDRREVYLSKLPGWLRYALGQLLKYLRKRFHPVAHVVDFYERMETPTPGR